MAVRQIGVGEEKLLCGDIESQRWHSGKAEESEGSHGEIELPEDLQVRRSKILAKLL